MHFAFPYSSTAAVTILNIFKFFNPDQVLLDKVVLERRALDEVVFDVLGLTAGEREAVYKAVVELVRKRLEKAKSV